MKSRSHSIPTHILLYLLAALVLSALPTCAVDPVIHWSFEGNGQDAMGNENINKFVKTTFSKDCVEGKQALSLDNTIENAALISTNSQEPKTFTQQSFQQRTISLWFKAKGPVQYPKDEQCLLKIGNNDQGIILYLDEKYIKASMFAPFDDMQLLKEVSTPFTLNQWAHVTLVFDNGTLTLFLDGKEMSKKSSENMTTMNTHGAGASLGFLKESNYAVPMHISDLTSFNGFIDDVKIFDTALQPTSIEELYNQHKAKAEAKSKLILKKPTLQIANSKKQFEAPIKFALNPVIHWRFEGDGLDEAETHHIKHFHETTFFEDEVEHNQSLYFDSEKESCVLITPMDKNSPHFIQKSYHQRTLSLWFKPETSKLDTYSKQCLLKAGDHDEGLFIYLQDNKLLTKIINKTQDHTSLTKELKTSYQQNEWNHLLLTFLEGKIAMYTNGKMVDQAEFQNTSEFSTITGGVSLGATLFAKENTNSNPYHGHLDNIQIFDVALDQDAINRLTKNKHVVKGTTVTLEGNKPFKFSTSNTSTASTGATNLVQGKSFYLGLGIFVLGIIGLITGLVLMFKKSLKTYNQYESEINKIG